MIIPHHKGQEYGPPEPVSMTPCLPTPPGPSPGSPLCYFDRHCNVPEHDHDSIPVPTKAGPSRAALKELFEAAHDWAGEVGYDHDMSRDPDCPDKTRRFIQALARCAEEMKGGGDGDK